MINLAQQKLNQKQYYCPLCERAMVHKTVNGIADDIHNVFCVNEDCDYHLMSWNIKKLESFAINQEQRLMEILEDD